MNAMNDVMISYSSKDKSIADAVCNHLESNGIRVWIAPRDIPGEKSYPTAIIKGIKSCKIIVLLFTANSNQSNWVPREIERGVTFGKIIIPFKIEDAKPVHSDLELCTCTQHWLDAMTPPLEANIDRLHYIIRKLITEKPAHEVDSIKQQYNSISPLKLFYQMAYRWKEDNFNYYHLESLSEIQKALLRNSPKSFHIEDETLRLFMLVASIHYGGDWPYWAECVENKHEMAFHLVSILSIAYIRPKYRALYLLQSLDNDLVKSLLASQKLDLDPALLQLMEKYVFTSDFLTYLQRLVVQNRPEISKRAQTVLYEIQRYTHTGNALEIFPDL